MEIHLHLFRKRTLTRTYHECVTVHDTRYILSLKKKTWKFSEEFSTIMKKIEVSVGQFSAAHNTSKFA